MDHHECGQESVVGGLFSQHWVCYAHLLRTISDYA